MLSDRELVPQAAEAADSPRPKAGGRLNKAAIASQEADGDLHQRALARPVLPYQPDGLARVDVQARPAQHLTVRGCLGAATMKRFGHVLNAKDLTAALGDAALAGAISGTRGSVEFLCRHQGFSDVAALA